MAEDKKKKGGWSSTSRYYEEQSVAEILQRITSKGVIADKFLEAEITALYEQMVGRQVARMTDNIFVRKQKLYIKVSSPALKQELVYNRQKIKDLINEKLTDKVSNYMVIKYIDEVIIL
ncbi:MAG: DUF721 domain-containing protein [Bacteroidales bacterium]|nr:DUF721 domain-containing protein [Bacteroidales bacterium]